MQLYNTLTRQKEAFTPLRPGKVGMYACGITAYDFCHIGHARSAIVFDVLARYLRHLGLDVTFVRNFTDVDDKIIARANKEGVSGQELSERYIAAFHEDMAFGTLDALLVVDLLNAPEKQLRRFLGEEGMAALRSGACNM